MESSAIVMENVSTGYVPGQPSSAVPLDALQEPGTYICNWSGHLLRVAELDAGMQRYAVAGDPESVPLTVTRISPDPHISRFEAKALADRFGLDARF